MNRRGFSLVELMAVISILGILIGVAIGAVSNYLEKAKNQAYSSIYKAASGACENYIIEHGLATSLDNNATGVVDLAVLVEESYMEDPVDPNTKTMCSGKIEYKMVKGSNKNKETIIENDSIVYRVTLECPGNKNLKPRVFPDGATF